MAWHDAEFLGSLSSVAPRTVQASRRDLAGFAAWAGRGGVHGPADVDRVPLRRYLAHRATRGDGRLPRVLKQDESTTLLDEPLAGAGDDPVRRARDDAVLELLYGSGMRVGELCALSVADVDLRRGRAVVWGKGGKQRAVP